MESLDLIKLNNLWILSLETDAILHMQMEVLCVTLCYMEHWCCPLCLFTSSCIKSTSFQSWIDQHLKHDRFHSLGKSPEVCSWSPLCTTVVLSSVVSLSHREDTLAPLLAMQRCWGQYNAPPSSPAHAGSLLIWTDVSELIWCLAWAWGCVNETCLPWEYSIRMCVPRDTGFMGGYCRLRSKLLRPQS